MASSSSSQQTIFPEPTQRCIAAAKEKGVDVHAVVFDVEVPTAQVSPPPPLPFLTH
jgi:hypothetical protein